MEVRDAILERQSIRKFKDEEISDKNLKDIFYLASKMPSSFNGQQTTIMYTRDKEKIEKIAKLCGGQPQVANCKVFMLLVTDLYKAKYALSQKGLEFKDDLERVKSMTKIDAGIMTYAINLAAHSYGYGCTIIGGVYGSEEELKKLFNLPKESIVCIGMTLGVPEPIYTKTNEKPKFSVEAIAMEDTYNYEIAKTAIFDYEKELDAWFKKIGVKQPLHSDVMANLLAKKG